MTTCPRCGAEVTDISTRVYVQDFKPSDATRNLLENAPMTLEPCGHQIHPSRLATENGEYVIKPRP